MKETYQARGAMIYCNDELFITVHMTEPVISGVITIEKQAQIIAKILNDVA